jgi:hypothetical protein
MKRFLIASLLSACAFAAANANASVLTFDDIPGAAQNRYGAIGTYAGYVFGSTGDVNQMDWIDTVTSNEFYNRGAVSGDFTMLNNNGGAAVIRKANGGAFTFGGLWAENWLDWDTAAGSLQGYLGGQLVWTSDVTLGGESFTWFAGTAGNIDELRIDFGEAQFLVDNLELNDAAAVPLPPTPALMGIGLAGLMLLRRRSRA